MFTRMMFLGAVALGLAASAPVAAQTPVRVQVDPASLTLDVGDRATVTARVFDADGNEVSAPLFFFSSSRRRLMVDRQSGEVEALKGVDLHVGEGQIVAFERVCSMASGIWEKEISSARKSPTATSVAALTPAGAVPPNFPAR